LDTDSQKISQIRGIKLPIDFVVDLTLVLLVALKVVVVFLLDVSPQVGRLGELVAAHGTLHIVHKNQSEKTKGSDPDDGFNAGLKERKNPLY